VDEIPADVAQRLLPVAEVFDRVARKKQKQAQSQR
jgi:hypothetical protein